MSLVSRALIALVLAASLTNAAALSGQATTSAQAPSAQPPADPAKPKVEPAPAQAPPVGAPAQPKPDEPTKYEETVIVTSSRSEQTLIDSPATISVITSEVIAGSPVQNFAELLRNVPGVNVTQTSARDINVTSRGATGTLATGQLALLDGRSLYQDFFGFVMWDFLPVNFNEVKQIEVIRGPASAVWGANALYGVVNVITKAPREMQGTSAVAGFGGFDRAAGGDAGSMWYLSGTYAQAIDKHWAYKISGGGYSQDALSRPTGTVPCDRPDVCSGLRGTYPPFANTGTAQPKIDGRVDYDYDDGSKLSISGGASGTDGIMHTGIGPFDIASGTVMGYAKANYSHRGFRAAFFTNLLNGDAANLLTGDAQGHPIGFKFDTSTYDFEASNVQTFAAKHVVTYGGNLRFNQSQLSIAPDADNRTEFGGYVQDEIFLSSMFRWIVGARVDHFDYLNNFVFSPRTTFMVKPRPDQAIRLSYNRAYRAPSVINNFLDLVIAQPINLGQISPVFGGLPPYLLPVSIQGNRDLTEQSLDAFEIGYTGAVAGRATVSAAFYVNNLKNDILFTQDHSVVYTAQNPPPNWPLPPAIIALLPGGSLPARFTYLNFGRSVQQGFELGLNAPVTADVNAFVNYSWQGTPDPKDFDLSELNIPAKNRVNAGFNFSRGNFLGDMSVNYSGSAFWQDVLDDPYHGTTKSYTLVNGGFGVRWSDGKVTTSLKVINLANQDVQQHVFGDIVKRQVVGEMKVHF